MRMRGDYQNNFEGVRQNRHIVNIDRFAGDMLDGAVMLNVVVGRAYYGVADVHQTAITSRALSIPDKS